MDELVGVIAGEVKEGIITGVGKLQLVGRMRPAKGIHAARQMLQNLKKKVVKQRQIILRAFVFLPNSSSSS